jgi:DNA replication protein DnaC
VEKLDTIKDYAKELNLNYLKINAGKIIEDAGLKDLSYQDMLISILKNEMDLKDKKAQERRLKNAGFPVVKRIEDFDLSFQRSITQRQINRLLEMDWIDRMYNLIFLGPPGVGKTHISVALGYKAVEAGYKVSFVSMDSLMKCLKTQDISRKSRG